MKSKHLLKIILFILSFAALALPICAEEEDTTEDDTCLVIYKGDEIRFVTIPKGSAIADLWEPETYNGYAFLYWTTEYYEPHNEAYRVTSETVFYDSCVTLYAVTENIDKEIEETLKEREELLALDAPTEQETEAERDFYEVTFHYCDGSHDYSTWCIDKNKKVDKEIIEEETEYVISKKKKVMSLPAGIQRRMAAERNSPIRQR